MILEELHRVGRGLDRCRPRELSRQLTELLREQITSNNLPPGARLPSQRTLSEICGISEVTVRRAMQELASEGLISARVGQGTYVLGFDADGEDHKVASRTASRIGIVYSQRSDGYPFFRPVLEGIQRYGDGSSSIQLFEVPGQPSPLDLNMSHLAFDGVDGLIFPSPVNLQLLARCQRERLPYVLQFNDICDGWSPCILLDYSSGILDAVTHLVKFKNRKKIALVTASHARFTTPHLVDALRTSLKAHGLACDLDQIVHAGYEEEHGYDATAQLLKAKSRPDAILYASDYQARGGLYAANDCGVDVPGELSIVGAGRLLRPRELPRSLSTVDLQFSEVGYQSMKILADLISSKTHEPIRHVVHSTYVEGETS